MSTGLFPVQGTADAAARFFHHVQINLRRLQFGVPQQFLHGADVGAVFEQMRGKGVPEHMRRHSFVQPGLTGRDL